MLDRSVDFLAADADQQAFVRENLFSDVLPKQEIEIEPVNAILAEQNNWISGILNGEPVRVSAEQGKQAVEIAAHVLDSMAAHCWSQGTPESTGPFAVVNTQNKTAVAGKISAATPIPVSMPLRKAG